MNSLAPLLAPDKQGATPRHRSLLRVYSQPPSLFGTSRLETLGRASKIAGSRKSASVHPSCDSLIAARTNACASLTCRTNEEAEPDMVHDSMLSGAIRSSYFVLSLAEDVVSCDSPSDIGLDILHSVRILLSEGYIGGRVAVSPPVDAQSFPSTGILPSLTKILVSRCVFRARFYSARNLN